MKNALNIDFLSNFIIIVDMSTKEKSMDRRVGKRIHYLANQNRAYVNAILKDEGLTHGECNLLVEIYRHDGISQEELGKKLRIDKSAITRVIKSMVEKGYTRKDINQNDRRYHCLYLTKQAIDKLDFIYDVFHKSSEWLLDDISEEDIESVMRILDKMCENVRKRVEEIER